MDVEYLFFEKLLLEGRLEEMSNIVADGKIPVAVYIDWTYDFQTRNREGGGIIESLEDVIFEKANYDDRYLKAICVFFSDWPNVVEDLKSYRHPGAVKISNTIFRNRSSGGR